MWAVARRVAAAGTCVVGTAFVASQERSFGLSDEEDDGQARISGGRHAQPTARQLDGERKLREWHGGLGARAARLNRGDIEDIDPHRHVVAMIGITGGGKSSTANTLMSKQRGSLRKKKKGRHDDDANSSSSTRTSAAATRETARGNQNIVRGNRNRRFKEANSLTSVTRSVSFRDYEFSGVPFRVIDTPGLADTNRTADEVEAELDLFRRIARFGVTAFVIVLPRGRITPEDENTLEQLFQIFGDSLKDHAIVVFTSALRSERLPSGSGAITKTLMTRDVLLEEIDHLEAGHFLRRYACCCCPFLTVCMLRRAACLTAHLDAIIVALLGDVPVDS
eukprot:INCI14790.4.p1 GENE.INCI14790.4~~INCI14790.4.p1  ORF type:complete len:336 (-),score=59.29 INCI14790.4:338-1345(-)